MAEAILKAMAAKGSTSSTRGRSSAAGGSDLQKSVELLARLTLTHEQEIASLTAATSFAIYVRAADVKAELSGIRATYDEGSVGEKSEGSTPALRVACHAALLVRLGRSLSATDANSKAVAESVLAMQAPAVAIGLVRFKPKYKSPPKDVKKGWLWLLTPSPTATGRQIAEFWNLAAQSEMLQKSDGDIQVTVAPVNQGRLAKELRETVFGKSAPSASKKPRTSRSASAESGK